MNLATPLINNAHETKSYRKTLNSSLPTGKFIYLSDSIDITKKSFHDFDFSFLHLLQVHSNELVCTLSYFFPSSITFKCSWLISLAVLTYLSPSNLFYVQLIVVYAYHKVYASVNHVVSLSKSNSSHCMGWCRFGWLAVRC